MRASFMIIDDFLADPMRARRAALSLEYDPAFKKGNYPGLLSTRPLAIEGLEETVSGSWARGSSPRRGLPTAIAG